MYEQFSRVANFYFLIMAILQSIPQLTPLSPGAAFAPLVMMVTISAVKAAMEDTKRGRSDRKLNNQSATILDHITQRWTYTTWQEVEVGQIVRIDKNQPIPADLLLISASGHEGLCFIETANLDGETNLKPRQGLLETYPYGDNDMALSKFKAEIECDPPNEDLYNFQGRLTIGDKVFPLSNNEILLRGCTLKNTDWVTGIIVYTGSDTKVMKNGCQVPTKRSSLDASVSLVLKIIIGIVIVICTFCTIGGRVWFAVLGQHYWYMGVDLEPTYNADLDSFIQFLSNIILYNTMIPISLIVTIELAHVFHAEFVNADPEMYDPESHKHCKTRNSNISEDLGQIDYIFSDKTGTLTRNVMEFFNCTIAGKKYGKGISEIAKSRARLEGVFLQEPNLPSLPGTEPSFVFKDPELHDDLQNSKNREVIREFLMNLAVCHTVIPIQDDFVHRGIRYEAASPDEATLVDAAKQLGFFFQSRSPSAIEVLVDSEKRKLRFSVLNIMEFNSKRKRMSVIVRTSEGKIRLYCKGADTVIAERLSQHQIHSFKDETWRDLELFANDGLRTLVLAYRDIPEDEYDEWNKKWIQDSLSLDKRKEKLEDRAEEIETDLQLLGGTAIEDKLAEGVPETINNLLKANIKVWVLTGDKQETAINIGYACSLLESDMEIIIINAEKEDEIITQFNNARDVIKNNKKPNQTFGMVVTGGALKHALMPEMAHNFLSIASVCKSVICCRVSPAQKASVVKLVGNTLRVRTLAIGDGANDVSMIHAAQIGIGISGKEGMQAVMASDYAIPQFKFLQKLLLVHGRWSYKRVSFIIVYAIWKNVIRVMSQFWFEIHSGFGTQTIYDTWTIQAWNMIFTSFPMISVAALDYDVSSEASMRFPQLYTHGQQNREFSLLKFFMWFVDACYCSAIIYYSIYLSFEDNHSSCILSATGRPYGFWAYSIYLSGITVIVSNLKIFLNIDVHHASTHAIIYFSILIWFVYIVAYSYSANILAQPEIEGVLYRIFGDGYFWLLLIVCIFLALLPEFIFNRIQREFFPYPYQIIQEMERAHKYEVLEAPPPATIPDKPKTRKHRMSVMATGKKKTQYEEGEQVHLGFAFSAGKDQNEYLEKRLRVHTKPLRRGIALPEEDYRNEKAIVEQ
eukprot:TRINITY_DN18240_c0_g1_i1.p1 TRINITY_DN18240_c0_g1~~TRINITY_DN18240_c0_g1_i1.p1  ORF type:complete len:1316 (+),score=309.58 TRINITY_DN18240_c0_g1_i1:539-3949(+)